VLSLQPKDFDNITDLKEHREIITDQYLGEADLVKTSMQSAMALSLLRTLYVPSERAFPIRHSKSNLF
jgi:hypothetical protein